jgi:hypothetical protein
MTHLHVPIQYQTPMEVMGFCAQWAAGFCAVPVENIAIDLKASRLLVHDRPHDDPNAKVTRILRSSRTGSGLWFEVEDGEVVGMADMPPKWWVPRG